MKEEDDLYQKIHGNIIFSVFMRRCYKYDMTLLAKNQRCPCPEKMHLTVTSPASLKKMIFILENIVFLLKYHIDWHQKKDTRNSHLRYSTRKGVLRNFTKFTDLCQSLFFNKVLKKSLFFYRRKACNFIKREALAMVFSCEFCEISKTTTFTEHSLVTASGVPIILCSFMETFIDVFIYCFPVKEKQETQYIGLKFYFFFNLYDWRYSLRSCI